MFLAAAVASLLAAAAAEVLIVAPAAVVAGDVTALAAVGTSASVSQIEASVLAGAFYVEPRRYFRWAIVASTTPPR